MMEVPLEQMLEYFIPVIKSLHIFAKFSLVNYVDLHRGYQLKDMFAQTIKETEGGLHSTGGSLWKWLPVSYLPSRKVKPEIG